MQWGRALEALLCGGEKAIIRTKLATIRSFFPHNDNSPATNIPDMYNDVLEFLRPGLYRPSVRRSAMESLLTQIRSAQILHLKAAVMSRTRVDLQDFISLITATCMDDVEQKYDKQYRTEQEVVLSTSSKEARALVSVLNLVAEIAAESDSMCRTVLKAGILDIVLRIYVIFSAFSQSVLDGPESWVALQSACACILLILSQSSPNCEDVVSHPVCSLWSECYPIPPAYTDVSPSFHETSLSRSNAWRRAPRSCVKRRIAMILLGCLWKSNARSIEDVEACGDILEFIRPQFYNAEIVNLAFLAMLKHILASGDHARHLMKAIVHCCHDDIVHIFSGTIRLWIDCITKQVGPNSMYDAGPHASDMETRPGSSNEVLLPIDVDDSLYDREKSRLFYAASHRDAALYSVLKFSIAVARHSSVARRGMLKAGALALVLTAFVNADFHLSGLHDAQAPNTYGRKPDALCLYMSTLPISLDTINARASALTLLIQRPTFRQAWRDESFNNRRHLCSLLVDGLQGTKSETGDIYALTYAHCRKILLS